MSTYVIGTWAVAIIRYAQDFDTNFTSSLPGSINLIRNGMFLHLAGIINIFRDQFDKFIAVTLLPFDQIGIYFVAVTLATAPITVTIGSLSSIIAPAIGTNETYPDKIECFCRYSRVSLLFGLVISCAFVFILPIIVHIILGENYESAISVSQILGISAVAACIRGVMNTGLIVLKDWRLQSSNEALAFIALAPAPLFAYYYGSMGLAMVTLFSALVSLIFCISQITKKFNIPVHMLIGSAQVFKNDFSPFISILRGSRIRNY